MKLRKIILTLFYIYSRHSDHFLCHPFLRGKIFKLKKTKPNPKTNFSPLSVVGTVKFYFDQKKEDTFLPFLCFFLPMSSDAELAEDSPLFFR